MVALAFAYYNYKFSEYKFIDFKQFILYEKKDIFKAKHERYTLLFYKSKTQDPKSILSKQQEYPILAIDYAQNKFLNDKKFTYVTAPTNTLLDIIQRFNIYKTPSIFIIKRSKESLYKQDSMIHVIK